MSTPTRWHGCYTESWQDLCVPEAFSHPAKFARGLIHRIYRHALEQRYLHPGMTVLDPFGGVALGALDAQTYGLSWLGCELEPRFHALGLANLALWRRRYGFHTGALVCGDSRALRQVVAGAWQGMVTSPPYEETVLSGGPTQNKQGYTQGARALTDYGTTPGQLGNTTAGTFWQAAAAILTECYAILAPQSVAIFVLKDYVRKKTRVPFCAHWRACCEAVGYTFVEEIHAMLVEDHGTQTGLFTADTTVTTERKSFFRRLAERKGSPRIDWETVLIMRRP